MISKEELLNKIEEKYGDLRDNTGTYLNGEWLSIYQIVSIIEDCYNYNN